MRGWTKDFKQILANLMIVIGICCSIFLLSSLLELSAINSIVFLGIIIGFFGLWLHLQVKIQKENATIYNASGTTLAALFGFFALMFVGYQAMQLKTSVDLQRNKFQLDQRPYVYLQFPAKEPLIQFSDEYGKYFGGGDLFFKNVGKEPATISNSDYLIASDLTGIIDNVGWFERAYGGYPDIKAVFPGQIDARVPCHPAINKKSKLPKLLYFGVVISYIGSDPDKKYWYKFSQIYVVKKIKANYYTLNPLKPDHDWDQNSNSQPPKLKEPDWNYYLQQKHIKTVTENN